ncbi:unnamed protein product [Didymodactylos carnosus]|uniref:Uncharacterized protein n=1 Tax=Didymodactylos carnosus TaxID=1234261 RepID=A0A816CEK2_9BILA|nr:unnamed protein product [Didymodactylos carnosus]CAF4513550.1 unnamed protein product [Didymodactylos carnosus]
MIGLLTIAVAVVQLYIASQQRERDLFLANETRVKDLEITEKNHQQALFLANEQTKDTILNDYLDFLAGFLEKHTDKSSNLNWAAISSIVEFKTFAVLDQLDGKRKSHIIKALYNARLIQSDNWFFVSLAYANLTEVELGHA